MKIKKKAKEIGTVGNRKMRRNPNTKKNPLWRKVMEPEKGAKEGEQPKAPGRMKPEHETLVKDYLKTEVGEILIRTLEPIARRDLHPGNLIIAFNEQIGAIDISVIFVETNTPLWANLQVVMWRNRMTWRFDSTGPQLMLVVRWFLPYLLTAPGAKQEEIPTAEEEVGQTKPSTLEAVP